MKPGDTGGECPRCGERVTLIGTDDGAVYGTVCETCDLMLALSGDAMTLSEALTHDWSDYEPPKSHPYGPDPWG